jgi:RNA polymerase sigma-70 factor (ECF subfamily)
MKFCIKWEAVEDSGPMDNTVYLKRWHDGDQKALDALLAHHLPWLKAQVRKKLGAALRRKGQTVDYVQEAMIQFLRYGPRFTLASSTQFRALLLRIAENAIKNQYRWYTAQRRAISRERPLHSDTILVLDPPRVRVNTPSQSLERHEREAWIRFGLEFLDAEGREIIVLRQWNNLSFTEIGERLGISTDAARMKHNRAVKRLGDKVWMLRSGKLNRVLGQDPSMEGSDAN